MEKISPKRRDATVVVAAITAIAAIVTTMYLYSEHFLLLKKNTIFIYTWDFLHQHIALPALEEWKWTGVFQTGGLTRYAEAFLAQFYTNALAVEVIQIPLATLWIFLWCKILGVPLSLPPHKPRAPKGSGCPLQSFCPAQSPTRAKRISATIPNAAKRAAAAVAVILTVAAAYLYIAISPAFPLGTTVGALLSAVQLYHFKTAKKAYSKITNIIAGTPALYYFAGIPSVLIYITGVLIIAVARIITALFLRSYTPVSNKSNNTINILIIIIIPLYTVVPYFAAKPLFLQSPQAAYNTDLFRQFKEKSTNNLYHTNEKTEYALYTNNYAKVLELCNKAYKKTERPTTRQQLYSLLELAYYTKTALLFNGELCDKFLQYYHLPAMQWLFSNPLPDKAMADLFFRLGELGCAKHAAINDMETYGLSAYTAKILNANSTKQGLQTPVDATSPPDIFILQMSQHQSPAIRDAKALIYLLFKQIDSAVAQFDNTPHLRLPKYIQEALLIKHGYGQNPAATQELNKHAISDQTIRKYEQFLQALQAYQYGQANPQQIAKHFAGTYAHYYYFQTAAYE